MCVHHGEGVCYDSVLVLCVVLAQCEKKICGEIFFSHMMVVESYISGETCSITIRLLSHDPLNSRMLIIM